MKKNMIETITGIVVLTLCVVFVLTVYKTNTKNDISKVDTYPLSASFERADGIEIGSNVMISGVKVGKVIVKQLDYTSYAAIVEMRIDKKLNLPTDTSAEIVSNGLFGEKYIALIPGADSEFLKENDTIEFTQSSISFESIISKMFSGVDTNQHSKYDNGGPENFDDDSNESDHSNMIEEKNEKMEKKIGNNLIAPHHTEIPGYIPSFYKKKYNKNSENSKVNNKTQVNYDDEINNNINDNIITNGNAANIHIVKFYKSYKSYLQYFTNQIIYRNNDIEQNNRINNKIKNNQLFLQMHNLQIPNAQIQNKYIPNAHNNIMLLNATQNIMQNSDTLYINEKESLNLIEDNVDEYEMALEQDTTIPCKATKLLILDINTGQKLQLIIEKHKKTTFRDLQIQSDLCFKEHNLALNKDSKALLNIIDTKSKEKIFFGWIMKRHKAISQPKYRNYFFILDGCLCDEV